MKVFFLVLVYVLIFDLFEFSDAILEKGLFPRRLNCLPDLSLVSCDVDLP